jgi:peptidoglycan/LPS O-acetylase OafA/YrhL
MSKEKLAGQDEPLDIEANIWADHTVISKPTFNTSLSLLTQRDKSSVVKKFLRYPAPGSHEIKSTSWLDGVRGVAALGVYMFHAMGCWVRLVPAWHSDEDQNNILQLPILRTLFVSGPAAVSLFFVISGYVLTHKYIRWMRGGSTHRVYPAVTSSMFRRGFRLYLPPIFLTFCEMLATRVGFSPPLNFNFVPESSLFAQFMDWLVETNHLVNPIYNFKTAIMGFVTHPKYDAVVWTIPLEFYGSFVCYILVLILVRIPRNGVRMGLVAVFSGLCMLMGSWNIFGFLAGMLIADFNLSQEENGTTLPSTNSMSRIKSGIWATMFAMALYMAGFPTLAAGDAVLKPMPGFEILRSLTPMGLNMDDHSRFWWSISGVVLLLSISKLPRLKSLFETTFCQYLGKISFSLYLVHVFCVVIFGLGLQGLLMRLAALQPHEKTLLYWLICGLWYFIFTVLVFALAAQVERWVDAPSVKFAKWLEGKCLKR